MQRTGYLVLAAALISGILYWMAAGPGVMAEPGPKPVPGGFAVLELFTSEGCSSCPSADKLLGEVIADARERKLPIHALAYHIDYWDKLGWKDPFGTAMATARQQAYANALSASVYTPQLVVNGAEEFVGSDNGRLQKSISAGLARSATARVTVTATPARQPGRVDVQYEVDGAPKGSVLQVVYAEDERSTSVKRGENAGRTLVHFHVVRALETIDLDRGASGATALDVPERQPGLVIAFVQGAKGLKVVGAGSAAVAASGKE